MSQVLVFIKKHIHGMHVPTNIYIYIYKKKHLKPFFLKARIYTLWYVIFHALIILTPLRTGTEIIQTSCKITGPLKSHKASCSM